MKIIGFIPARKGSKGLLNKNVLPLNGRPLISYTIQAAIESKLDDIYVSSDIDEVETLCNEQKINFRRRPEHLADDNSSMHETIIDFINNIEIEFDALMILQPTSPLRNSNDINISIENFKRHQSDCLVSVCKIPHNYSIEKQMIYQNGYLKGGLNLSNKQNIKESYARNGAIYITKKNKIYDYLVGGKILKYEMPYYKSIDIESQEDLDIVKLLMYK